MMSASTTKNYSLVGGLLALGIVLELLTLYKPTLIWIKNSWLSYSPDRLGMSVPIFFGLIAAFKLSKKPSGTLGTDISGLLLLLLSLCMFFVGILADIHIIQAVSLILFGFGFMVYWSGIALGKRFFFLFAFLMFMIPSVSFLLESLAGVQLRNAIAMLSGLFLVVTGGAWAQGIDGLLYQDIVLPVQYCRNSLSSPLPLLIFTCVIAELVFEKNRHKFVFALIFFPLFILAHGIFISALGWSFQYSFDHTLEILWDQQWWIPALIYMILLLTISGFTVYGQHSKTLLRKKLYASSKQGNADDQ